MLVVHAGDVETMLGMLTGKCKMRQFRENKCCKIQHFTGPDEKREKKESDLFFQNKSAPLQMVYVLRLSPG